MLSLLSSSSIRKVKLGNLIEKHGELLSVNQCVNKEHGHERVDNEPKKYQYPLRPAQTFSINCKLNCAAEQEQAVATKGAKAQVKELFQTRRIFQEQHSSVMVALAGENS